jgi:hypothetical protein
MRKRVTSHRKLIWLLSMEMLAIVSRRRALRRATRLDEEMGQRPSDPPCALLRLRRYGPEKCESLRGTMLKSLVATYRDVCANFCL